MNYNRPIIITLLALLSLCSVLARAGDDNQFIPVNPTKPNGLPNSTYPDLRNSIDRRMDKLNALSGSLDQMTEEAKKAQIQLQEIERKKGGATVTVAKNYPVVPYDPNHPNVQKQKKTSFNIKANAKTLAGRFARGLNGVALGYAVVDLLGEGVDWALDPENNSIIYTSTSDNQYCYGDTCSATPELLCKQIASNVQSAESSRYKTSVTVKAHEWNETSCTTLTPAFYNPVNRTNHSDFYYSYEITKGPASKDNSMSLDTIANHVINNEDNSTTNNITNNYYNTVNETIIEQIENGEHDNDIETAVRNVSQDDSISPSPAPETQSEEQPSDESKPFELPPFCDWAGKVCDFIDWVKKDDNDKDTQVDIQDNNLPKIDTKINFNGQCPNDIVLNATIFGKTFEFFTFKWSKFCEILAMLKYIIIALAGYQVIKILGGHNVSD